MPRSYQPINPTTDTTTTRTFLHEVIPITGTILSGTYGTFPDNTNIKNYTHGMFQSVYDYPYLSSSANHIFDLTVGYGSFTELSASGNTQNSKKINMYTSHALTLLGLTASTTASLAADSIRSFESDLVLDQVGTMGAVFFVDLSRLLVKDEIKKNTFSITLATGSWENSKESGQSLTLQDARARVNGDNVNTTLGGDYGVLYTASVASAGDAGYGVVFYQAGVAVITASIFSTPQGFIDGAQGNFIPDFHKRNGGQTLNVLHTLASASISGACDAFRHRIQNISFNNTTEINSTIHTCRAGYNAFNYSSNPTYVKNSKIVVKDIASDNPVAYVTTVGLYNAQNELLAVAKLSEPLRKSVSNELSIRVRLDY